MNIQLIQRLKKISATVTLVVVMLTQNVLVLPTFAEEPTAPTAPSAPSAPTAPTAPSAPSAPTAPTAPTAPSAPSAPTAPTAPSAEASPAQSSQGSNGNGNVGDTTVSTGDANNNSSTGTYGNNNLATTGTGGNGSNSVTNSGNGAGSTNGGSATTTTNNNNNQNNSATVQNGVNQNTVTGGNSTSFNTGNSAITTGDANSSATVVTAVNTNVAGVAVSEFNIADDHVGDIILDYNASCVSGCAGTPELNVNNTGNGAGSTNTGSASHTTNNNNTQTNDAVIGSTLTLGADSGNNNASFNTGGDSSITTGDANVSANVVTFANNNVLGNVVYGVVNIFGDLIGDIIIPESVLQSACATCATGNTAVSNTGNGAGSINTASANTTTNTNTDQFNTANIDNTILIDANTGDNDTNFNTGGNSVTTTGDAHVTANILNIANTNINGGTYWLVIVNEAGKWIGKILGSPDGQNYAGSPMFEFEVGQNGEITASNNGNGAESTNNASTNSTTNTNNTQTNTASIENTLNLSANTGDNSTSYNTGGESNIHTGDASVIANIVNFVNNNIIGDGKLVVTVVNVFGSWLGDLVTPGQTQQPKNTTAHNQETNNHIGGTAYTQETKSTTPTKTSTHKDIFEKKVAVAATVTQPTAHGTTSVSVTNSGNNSQTDALVAGATSKNIENTTAEEIVATAQQVTINLAWLLVVLPIGLILVKTARTLRSRRNSAPPVNI